MASATAVSLQPEVELPADRGLSDLHLLFDPEWVAAAYKSLADSKEPSPAGFRVRQISHTPGRVAVVSYITEWDSETYLPSRHFVARAERAKPVEVFQFPNDRHLPGLPRAADPETAVELVASHVMAIRPRTLGVEVIRYRPSNRAVLFHRAGRARFYARVMRPSALAAFLRSWGVVARSDFVAPRVAGHWDDGGVVWMSEIPGKNLRRLIRKRQHSDPAALLGGLASLWAQPPSGQGPPFNLLGAYRRAKRSFTYLQTDTASEAMARITAVLDPFVEAWRPSTVAHNDFYDDQLLVLPDGRAALVDFEEAGPGDPMLDVGNFIAHLQWRSGFGREEYADANAAYRDELRSAALDRFGWPERDLDLREAVCLFRICTNAIRNPREDWRAKLESGLALVEEALK